eukprot:10878581-Alexandrium_andersonii.AAC.1
MIALVVAAQSLAFAGQPARASVRTCAVCDPVLLKGRLRRQPCFWRGLRDDRAWLVCRAAPGCAGPGGAWPTIQGPFS